ncbi:GNAT family N-acetyltransferase [Streptomyces sp. NPDC050617]|uniref:GNAT family N-acetyltransferase n=1 Tax=Streptomyces sp. NPDC050617 TaxID=3154628 RepID=UPI003426419D
MTTTLRPTAAEGRTEHGGRSRPYEVCVNSRPVGGIELATDERFGACVGRIVRLRIDEADRHRGRGTVAALAAEEVLRGWGCGRAELSVPAAALPALSLAAALGYTERSRSMTKALTTVPELPAGSAVRPIGAAEFPAWQAASREGYVQELAERGLGRAEAMAKSAADHVALLPDGAESADTALRFLVHDGVDVGALWVRLRGPKGPGGFVYDIEIDPGHRGRGHGRTLMLAAERECLAAGADRIGLSVFADNTPAVRLYASLGYEATDSHFYKPLL